MYEAKPLQSGNLFQNGTRLPNGRHIVNRRGKPMWSGFSLIE